MIDMLGAGGAQRQLVELATSYKERGYEVAFLIYYKAFDNYYDRVLAKANIPIMDINESNYLLRIIKMRRMIVKYAPDVIIAFLEVPAFIAEMASILPHKWRLIVGERSASPKKLTNKRLRFFLHCHRFADAVVANSHANLEIVQQVAPELDKTKQHVIYNSLNPDNFTIEQSSEKPTDIKRILIASSHQYLKNLDGLIEAIHLMAESDRKKLHIEWYGHNKFSTYDHSLEEGKKKISRYGLSDYFSFHDATLDIYIHMRSADAVALLSKYEGFPNAICEGMFLAKPIIATKVSDIPLILKEDDNAFLADPNSPASIAAAITKFLHASSGQLNQMGQNNRKKAQLLFNKQTILDQYEQLF